MGINNSAPTDASYKSVQSGWSVGNGYTPTQLGNPGTDSNGQAYAPIAIGANPNAVALSGTAVAAAGLTVTLPAVAGKTNYISGFHVTSANPAAVVNGLVTVTGMIGGTFNYQYVESVTLGGELLVTFPQPIPASGVNVAIAVVLAAITSGAASAIVVFGYVQ